MIIKHLYVFEIKHREEKGCAMIYNLFFWYSSFYRSSIYFYYKFDFVCSENIKTDHNLTFTIPTEFNTVYRHNTIKRHFHVLLHEIIS